MCEVTKCESCNVEQSVNNEQVVITEQYLGEQAIGEGIPFERIRRITGYISGDYVKSFNDAKKKSRLKKHISV